MGLGFESPCAHQNLNRLYVGFNFGLETLDENPRNNGVRTATEAAATVYYKSKQDVGIGADAGKVEREWEFQGAYGLKK